MESARCKAFVTAVEAGSFKAAADLLGYTPSGVSQLVAALEDDLGFPLLLRSRKGVVPTASGERLLPVARRMLSDEEQLYQLAGEIKGLIVGTITIAAYPSIATHWLPAVIKAFEDEYPAVEIHLMEGIAQEIREWLDTSVADLAFFSRPKQGAYHWTVLAKDPMVAVLPQDHPLAEASEYPLAQIEEESFIMPALGHDVDVMALFAESGVTPQIKFSTLENIACMAMIEKGLGMSVMNQLCTQNVTFDVAQIPVSPARHMELGMATHERKEPSPAVRRFAQFARGMLQEPEVAIDRGRKK